MVTVSTTRVHVDFPCPWIGRGWGWGEGEQERPQAVSLCQEYLCVVVHAPEVPQTNYTPN